MPSIMQDSQQVAALAEISAALEMVKGLNALLTPGKDGSYQIVFSPEKGGCIHCGFRPAKHRDYRCTHQCGPRGSR